MLIYFKYIRLICSQCGDLTKLGVLRISIWLRQALGGACSSTRSSMGCRSGSRSSAGRVDCRAAHGGAHGCAHVLARAHPRARQALRRRLSRPRRPVGRTALNDRTVTSPVTYFWNRRRKNAAIRKNGGRRSRRKKVCLSPGYGAGCYKWTMLSRLKH